MKIAIDTQTIYGNRTGFGYYVKNLVENILKIDRKNQYFQIHPAGSEDLSAPKRFAWDQIGFPGSALKHKPDILHQPCFSAPYLHKKAKVVLTCHDIIAITFSKDLPFFSRQYFGKWMPFSYKFADKIICDSINTKNDLIKLLNVPEDKLKVVYLAASENFKPVNDDKKISLIKEKYHIKGDYLMYLGTLNPRKNIELLIDIFPEVLKKNPNITLVVAGKKTWHYQSLHDLTEKLGIENKVVFTDYISDEDSIFLYNGAEIFLFPSLYEGFGLPPLEAMSCGIPVISSDATSLKEVVKDGGVLISPDDKALWIEKINKILDNRNYRLNLEEKAIKRVREFSWKKCAMETLKVYEEVYENRN